MLFVLETGMVIAESRIVTPDHRLPFQGDLLSRLGISDRKEKITKHSPLVIVSPESATINSFPNVDMSTLDERPILLQAELEKIPTLVISPFYPERTYFSAESENFQTDVWRRPQLDRQGNFDPDVLPLHGFSLATMKDRNIFLVGYEKQIGEYVRPIAVFDQSLREAYYGDPTDGHRLWQYVVIGAGAAKLWENARIAPAAVVLNGSETALAALQTLDALTATMSLLAAAAEIKDQFVYMPRPDDAGNSHRFSIDLVDKYVIPNLQNAQVIEEVYDLTRGDNGLHMPTLAQTLATTIPAPFSG